MNVTNSILLAICRGHPSPEFLSNLTIAGLGEEMIGGWSDIIFRSEKGKKTYSMGHGVGYSKNFRDNIVLLHK